MAEATNITSRRALLGAIAIVPTAIVTPAAARPDLWAKRKDEYLLRNAWREADERFGKLAKATQAWDAFRAKAVAKYGSWERARANSDAAESCRVAYETYQAADQRQWREFVEPLYRAAAALVMTPAPTAEEAVFKIKVINDHDLETMNAIPRDAIDLVNNDMVRLLGGAR